MTLIIVLKTTIFEIKSQLQGNSIDNLLWLINFIPKLFGFSIERDNVFAPFWIVTVFLIFYVYGIGSVVYQVKFAQTPGDFVKNYFNVSILIFVVTNCYWWIKQRPLLKTVLKQVTENDRLSRETRGLIGTHKKLLSVVKKIILIFYGFNLTDSTVIYLPHRIDVSNNYYSMTPCVGLDPLTATPNRQICLTILALQEFSILIVVLSFQALILFLIAHTSAMYQLLSKEMHLLDQYGNGKLHYQVVREKLPSLIARHILTIDIIKKLKMLYSMPMGVNFGTNAICIALFFYLSLQEWVNYSPILIYCFLVFFLYCYLGQKLIEASEQFERSVYACGWEKFELREKKMVYTMLIQAQKPIKLLAADIIPVNIYTLATTLQMMYKFITVVKF